MYNQNIRYSFKEDELQPSKCPDISQYEYLYDNIGFKNKKRRKFAETCKFPARFIPFLPIYFFIFVCYYIKVIFKACKTLRKEIKMKKLNLKAIAVAMAAALTLGLAGCSSNG